MKEKTIGIAIWNDFRSFTVRTCGIIVVPGVENLIGTSENGVTVDIGIIVVIHYHHWLTPVAILIKNVVKYFH